MGEKKIDGKGTQQAIREQMAARVNSREQENNHSKNKNYTKTQARQIAIVESKKRQSWFCSHPL